MDPVERPDDTAPESVLRSITVTLARFFQGTHRRIAVTSSRRHDNSNARFSPEDLFSIQTIFRKR